MATCLDAAGAEYPETFDGHKIPPSDGKSLLPLLEGRDAPVHEEIICWEHEGNRAARQGPWKLVKIYEEPWELYNLDTDRTELNDLVEAMPDKAKELTDAWESWAERVGVGEWIPRKRRKKQQAK